MVSNIGVFGRVILTEKSQAIAEFLEAIVRVLTEEYGEGELFNGRLFTDITFTVEPGRYYRVFPRRDSSGTLWGVTVYYLGYSYDVITTYSLDIAESDGGLLVKYMSPHSKRTWQVRDNRVIQIWG